MANKKSERKETVTFKIIVSGVVVKKTTHMDIEGRVSTDTVETVVKDVTLSGTAEDLSNWVSGMLAQ